MINRYLMKPSLSHLFSSSFVNQEETVEVSFTHPRDSSTYQADVSPRLTAKQALSHLQSRETSQFLPSLRQGEHYELVVQRTNAVIQPHMSMIDAGVVEGDILEVVIGGQGAWLSVPIVFLDGM
jgi:hypothetical protein